MLAVRHHPVALGKGKENLQAILGVKVFVFQMCGYQYCKCTTAFFHRKFRISAGGAPAAVLLLQRDSTRFCADRDAQAAEQFLNLFHKASLYR